MCSVENGITRQRERWCRRYELNLNFQIPWLGSEPESALNEKYSTSRARAPLADCVLKPLVASSSLANPLQNPSGKLMNARLRGNWYSTVKHTEAHQKPEVAQLNQGKPAAMSSAVYSCRTLHNNLRRLLHLADSLLARRVTQVIEVYLLTVPIDPRCHHAEAIKLRAPRLYARREIHVH